MEMLGITNVVLISFITKLPRRYFVIGVVDYWKQLASPFFYYLIFLAARGPHVECGDDVDK